MKNLNDIMKEETANIDDVFALKVGVAAAIKQYMENFNDRKFILAELHPHANSRLPVIMYDLKILEQLINLQYKLTDAIEVEILIKKKIKE